MSIPRTSLHQKLHRALLDYPVVALLGPRQCGKTTAALQIAEGRRFDHFDLEDPISQRRLAEPMTTLRPLRGLIILDEVQLRPDLFPILRVLADRHPTPARFLVLGSASPDLLRQSSESLAGRIALIEMAGFNLEETGADAQRRLWWRGGFPRAFLAATDAQARDWQDNFVRTFVDRDVRNFGIQINPPKLRRLCMMVANYHGQTGNASEMARSLGESHTTVARHVDVLSAALLVRQLQPWFQNVGKRQVKSPKLYIRDTGILHGLLGVPSFRMLEGDPKLGASWEGFVIEQIIRQVGGSNAYFWGTQSGAELDLLLTVRGKRVGVEIKYADAPGMTKSMHIAMADLKLDRLFVVYPGTETYPLADRVTVLPLEALLADFRGAPRKSRSRKLQ